jgi:hypothetical protein
MRARPGWNGWACERPDREAGRPDRAAGRRWAGPRRRHERWRRPVTRLFVDAWDPAYGASLESAAGADGPVSPSSAQISPDVELPAAQWRPLDPPPDARCPDLVLLVDGVRRIDAGLWTAEDDGGSFPGLAASYAAGVVRCDLRRGAAELAGTRVERGLFTASPSVGDVVAGTVRYAVRRVGGTGEASKLPVAVQAPLTAL